MHRKLAFFLLIATLAVGQAKPQKTPAHPEETAKPESSSALPSEDTVKAFMQAMFGYEGDVTWKIQSIKPTHVAGLAEVVVVITGPKGPAGNKFYVTPDGKHAIIGEIMPFGPHP